MASSIEISVIIPLYNGATYIRQALDSVFVQTLPPKEIIVVDDGSTDNGPAIVQNIAKIHPITLLRKPNGGQSSARNCGVKHSTGGLFALLDQDDMWYPDHLAELSKPFTNAADPSLGWVYSNLDIVNETGAITTPRALRIFPATHPKTSLERCLSEDMYILPSATLISRKAFDKVGGFDERLSGFEDDDLFVRLMQAGYSSLYIDTPLSQWRFHDDRCSHSPRMAKSGALYARKLFTTMPIAWRAGMARRFYATFLYCYTLALKADDRSAMEMVAEELRRLIPYLSGRRLLVARVATPVMCRPRIAQASYSAYCRLRPILRPILAR